MTDRNAAQQAVTQSVSAIGMLLVPITAFFLLLEIWRGEYWLQRIFTESHISSRRQTWETVLCLAVGLAGPMSVALIWFDLLKTGMTNRSRLALIGYLGSVVAGLAVLAFSPFAGGGLR